MFGCPDSPFKRKLRTEYDFPETRANDLAEALWALLKAIAALDFRNLRKFSQKTLEEWLSEFAEAEDVRDVVKEMEKMRKKE